jgi:MOSC domain-containing protein YiiM
VSAPRVLAVARDDRHRFSKALVPEIELIAGIGVRGDSHAGATVQHRSRVRADPAQPNLRQVHLLQAELLDELRDLGFPVGPGDLGENVATRGLDLLSLPLGSRLSLGDAATVALTGLRNPCAQIEAFSPGLLAAVLIRRPDGGVTRRAGVMGVVVRGGRVRPGDPIGITLPPEPHAALERV